jgi:endonuclease YncB( thermonuclease family)
MASAPSLLCLRGSLVIEGKAPDGDSIRLIPDTPGRLDDLRRADRIRVSPVDGSVQLRLEGIDAPETSYGPAGQPLGTAARDRLVRLAGFTAVRRAGGGATVTSARPDRVPAAVLSVLADANGRPVCFLLVGDDLPADGDFVALEPALLERTLNHALLADGSAYLTLYDSLAPVLRRALRAVAAGARSEGRGVWARDSTAEFDLAGQESIGPEGALILPKLFRRCTDYLETRQGRETLRTWLRTTGDETRPEDDRVLVGRIQTRLSDLVEQRNRTIAFAADLLDLVFIEK